MAGRIKIFFFPLKQIGIETGLNYSKEKNEIDTKEFNELGIQTREGHTSYREDFLQVPAALMIYPYSGKSLDAANNPIYFKLGVNIDFIVLDKTTVDSHLYYDHHFPLPPGTSLDSQKKDAGSDTYKMRFNRLSPLFSFGQLIGLHHKVSFYYSFATFQFFPMIQKRNTVAYFRNMRYGMISLGVNYNF